MLFSSIIEHLYNKNDKREHALGKSPSVLFLFMIAFRYVILILAFQFKRVLYTCYFIHKQLVNL